MLPLSSSPEVDFDNSISQQKYLFSVKDITAHYCPAINRIESTG